MRDKGVMIVTLVLLLLAFVASTFFGESPASGAIVAHEIKGGEECSEDLTLMDGKYVVPCVNGELSWKKKVTYFESDARLIQNFNVLNTKLNAVGFDG